MAVSYRANTVGPLSKDVLHPQSMNVTRACANIKLARVGDCRYPFNYQAQLVATPKGTWLCVWTQGSHEGERDQRVVLARSQDGGHTWSAEVAIEEAASGYRVPAWIMIFCVPHTNRSLAYRVREDLDRE